MYRGRLHSSEQPSLHGKSEHSLSKQNSLLILSWDIKQRKFLISLKGGVYSGKYGKPKLARMPHMPN